MTGPVQCGRSDNPGHDADNCVDCHVLRIWAEHPAGDQAPVGEIAELLPARLRRQFWRSAVLRLAKLTPSTSEDPE